MFYTYVTNIETNKNNCKRFLRSTEEMKDEWKEDSMNTRNHSERQFKSFDTTLKGIVWNVKFQNLTNLDYDILYIVLVYYLPVCKSWLIYVPAVAVVELGVNSMGLFVSPFVR